MELVVDRETCRGHARCIALLPEAFEFNDIEDQAVAVPGNAADIPIHLLQDVVRGCPEAAIRLLDASPEGEQ
jgi:ferredoxin